MHRSTPLNSSMRGYCGGGARSCVDQVDDTQLMQEMAGNFTANETRSGVEAPQNYGFTSVVFDAEKGQDGTIQACAETFVGFMGSNRSLPVTGNMDDRRHRLYQLQKGDTAMFRGRGDLQQFHMTQDGGFWTGPQDKTLRMQLVQQDSQSNATVQSGGSSSTPSAQPRDASSGSGGSSSSSSSGQQQRGQQAIYKNGRKSPLFVDITQSKTRVSGNEVHSMLSDGNTYLHVNSDKNVYVGGAAGSGSFAMLATLSGPCINSLGKIG